MGDSTNIILSPALVYYAPVGEAHPADSVAAGTAWGGNWVELGFTKDPVNWTATRDEYEVKVQQTPLAVERVVTSEGHTFETILSEITNDNLQLALGGTATDTAAGAGQVGKQELVAGGSFCLAEYAWGFEGKACTATGTTFPVRLFVYRGTANISGSLTFNKEEEMGIGLMISALADTSQADGAQAFKWQRVTAAATS